MVGRLEKIEEALRLLPQLPAAAAAHNHEEGDRAHATEPEVAASAERAQHRTQRQHAAPE